MSLIWNETQPAGNVDKDWAKFLSNSNGNILLALYYNEYYEYILYITTDSGDTWNLRDPSGLGYVLDKIVMSNDGLTMFALCYNYNGSYLYISHNAGDGWSEVTKPTEELYGLYNIAISGNGLLLYVPATGAANGFWVSSDFGENWINKDDSTVYYSSRIGVNEDGSIVIAAGVNDEYVPKIYISKNSCTSWVELNPIIEGTSIEGYANVSISSDGSVIVVGYGYYDPEYHTITSLSLDGGETWEQTMGEETTVSKDGGTLLQSNSSWPKYSKDNGQTWLSCEPSAPPPPEPYWWAWHLTINSDGTKFIAGNLATPNPK